MTSFLLPFVAFFYLSAAQAADIATQGEHPTNAELKAMFESDQAERKVAEIDWDKLEADDEARRTRTRALMDLTEMNLVPDSVRAVMLVPIRSKQEQHGQFICGSVARSSTTK